MAVGKYKFSPHQRWAIFTVHGEKCYSCNKPLNLMDMQVDHIIPETLLGDPERLAKVRELFGLPTDFDINTYSNWLPACSKCNNIKRDRVFEPAPIFLIQLEIAADRAEDALRLEQQGIADNRISKLLNEMERAFGLRRSDLAAIKFLSDIAKSPAAHGPQSVQVGPITIHPRDIDEISVSTITRGKDGIKSVNTYHFPWVDLTIQVSEDDQWELSLSNALEQGNFNFGPLEFMAQVRNLPAIIYKDPIGQEPPALQAESKDDPSQ